MSLEYFIPCILAAAREQFRSFGASLVVYHGRNSADSSAKGLPEISSAAVAAACGDIVVITSGTNFVHNANKDSGNSSDAFRVVAVNRTGALQVQCPHGLPP